MKKYKPFAILRVQGFSICYSDDVFPIAVRLDGDLAVIRLGLRRVRHIGHTHVFGGDFCLDEKPPKMSELPDRHIDYLRV